MRLNFHFDHCPDPAFAYWFHVTRQGGAQELVVGYTKVATEAELRDILRQLTPVLVAEDCGDDAWQSVDEMLDRDLETWARGVVTIEPDVQGWRLLQQFS